MNIIEVLKQEESKLQRQLMAVKDAIAALNGDTKTAASLGHAVMLPDTNGKRVVSAAARAKMSRKAKARWARVRAEKAKRRSKTFNI